MRRTVRFADAVRALDAAGVTGYAEVGPGRRARSGGGGVLAGDPVAVAVSGDGGDEVAALLDALARLHVRGASVGWPAVFAGSGARVVGLPTYPFQRRRYWLDPPPPARLPNPPTCAPFRPPRPSAGSGYRCSADAAPVPGTGRIACTGQVSLVSYPWLADHEVGGGRCCRHPLSSTWRYARVPKPAATRSRTWRCRAAGAAVHRRGAAAGLARRARRGRAADRGDPLAASGRGHSRGVDEARDRDARAVRAAGDQTLSAWPPPGAAVVDIEGAYDALASAGLGYGPAFPPGACRMARRPAGVRRGQPG